MSVITRVKPYVQITLWLGVLAIAINVVLSVLAGTPVLRWLPKTVSGNGYLEDARARVSEATEEYRAGRLKPGTHLGAFVGISNVRQDINLAVIADGAGPEWRFIGLAGAGIGIGDVARHAEVLLSSDLRPDLVVLGFGLQQLVDTRPKPGAVNVGVVEYLRRADLRNAATGIRNSVWAYSRRQDVSLTTQSAVLMARASLFHLFGVELSQTEENHRSPWREMIKSDWPAHFSANTLHEEEQFFADLGVFDRKTYENSPVAAATLNTLIAQFRDRGAKVVILLMPEHSTLQRRIPQEARALMEARLRQAFPETGLHLLDFRRSVDDSGFVDLAHLNQEGSLEFSRLLAKTMRDLPEKPSLSTRRNEADPP